MDQLGTELVQEMDSEVRHEGDVEQAFDGRHVQLEQILACQKGREYRRSFTLSLQQEVEIQASSNRIVGACALIRWIISLFGMSDPRARVQFPAPEPQQHQRVGTDLQERRLGDGRQSVTARQEKIALQRRLRWGARKHLCGNCRPLSLSQGRPRLHTVQTAVRECQRVKRKHIGVVRGFDRIQVVRALLLVVCVLIQKFFSRQIVEVFSVDTGDCGFHAGRSC
jgi:hypothetical protein